MNLECDLIGVVISKLVHIEGEECVERIGVEKLTGKEFTARNTNQVCPTYNAV